MSTEKPKSFSPVLRISYNYCDTSTPVSLWLHSNEGNVKACGCGVFTLPLHVFLYAPSLYVHIYKRSPSASFPSSSVAKGFWRRCCFLKKEDPKLICLLVMKWLRSRKNLDREAFLKEVRE